MVDIFVHIQNMSKLRQLFSLGLNFGKKEFILKSVTIRKLSSRKS